MVQAAVSLSTVAGLALLAIRCQSRASILKILFDERHQDVFVLGLVSLCLSMSLVTGRLGLSLEMGAFLAGVTVRGTHSLAWQPGCFNTGDRCVCVCVCVCVGVCVGGWVCVCVGGWVGGCCAVPEFERWVRSGHMVSRHQPLFV